MSGLYPPQFRQGLAGLVPPSTASDVSGNKLLRADGTWATPPTSSLPVSLTLFVDSVSGSDSTGTRGRFDLPFATFMGAYNAASTGDVIELRPGTHTIPNGTATLNKALTINITAGATLSYVNTSSRSTVLFGGTGLATDWELNIVGDGTLAVSSTASWGPTTNNAVIIGSQATSGSSRVNINLGTLQLGPFQATDFGLGVLIAPTANLGTSSVSTIVDIRRVRVDTSNQGGPMMIFLPATNTSFTIGDYRRVVGSGNDTMFQLVWGANGSAIVGSTNASALVNLTDHSGQFRCWVGHTPSGTVALFSSRYAVQVGNFDLHFDLNGNTLANFHYGNRSSPGRVRIVNAKIPAFTLTDSGALTGSATYSFQDCEFTGAITIPSGTTNKAFNFSNCNLVTSGSGSLFTNNTGGTITVNVYGILAADGGTLGTNMATRGGSFVSDAGFTRRIS